MQEETTSAMWQSYVKLVSIINPKSFAEGTGLIVSLKKFKLISEGRFCSSFHVPISRY
jgi:hypothetical protein